MPHITMKRLSTVLALLTATAMLWLASTARGAEGQKDVLSIGGSVTEIIYALGEGDRLVARDTTSSYPPEAEDLPDVGYMRALSAEGVLSVNPSLILSEEGAGPPEAIKVLEAADLKFITVPKALDGEGIAAKIRSIGAALNVPEKAETLADDVAARMAGAQARAAEAAGDTPKRVMFILSTQGGRLMVSGTGTEADAIIRLAGGVNAVDAFENYKPITDEAAAAAAPDVILMMDRGGDHGMEDDALFALPALQPTPAAQNGAVVRMGGLFLLGFGPRTAEAVGDLSQALYGE